MKTAPETQHENPTLKSIIATEPPKIFWRYYDLYRRKKMSLEKFAQCSNLPMDELRQYLSYV